MEDMGYLPKRDDILHLATFKVPKPIKREAWSRRFILQLTDNPESCGTWFHKSAHPILGTPTWLGSHQCSDSGWVFLFMWPWKKPPLDKGGDEGSNNYGRHNQPGSGQTEGKNSEENREWGCGKSRGQKPKREEVPGPRGKKSLAILMDLVSPDPKETTGCEGVCPISFPFSDDFEDTWPGATSPVAMQYADF